MKKRVITFSALLFTLLLLYAQAAVYSTSAVESSQGYTVTARAYWEYDTGYYNSKGPHTVNVKPGDTLFTMHSLEYVLTHQDNVFKVTQYFRPVYYNPITDITTYGNNFSIVVNSAGPY